MLERTRQIAGFIADDATVSDYDMWRELKTIHLQLYEIERDHGVVPISLLYRRRVLTLAMTTRSRRVES